MDSNNDRNNHLVNTQILYTNFLPHAAGVRNAFADLLTSVTNHLATGRCDVIHDLLAFLAEQMIKMNKTKQIEVKGFLAWLEREIGTSIDDLTNKSKIRNYLGDYQKGEDYLPLNNLLVVLRQNSRKLMVDPGGRAFQELLEKEYGATLKKLLPLKGQLKATDWLIDQIVYQLYGLTEDEITIVEGRV